MDETISLVLCSGTDDKLQAVKLEPSQLDPFVDGVEGVPASYLNAGEGQILFI